MSKKVGWKPVIMAVIGATLLGAGMSMVAYGAGSVPKSEPSNKKENPMVTIKTRMGDITLELYPDKAPITVENFLKYVDEKFYDGTIFHRVIKGFMVQRGGMTANMRKKQTHDSIKNEAENGLTNDRGTVAMARTPDIHSASSQFFINVVDNAFLNYRNSSPGGYGYCVFGKVTSGMEVVDQIKAVPTGAGDVPVETIEMIEVSRVGSGE